MKHSSDKNIKQQNTQLTKLLKKAATTEFGKKHKFNEILISSTLTDRYKYFENHVPIHTYDEIYEQWWNQIYKGEKNICWPGKVKFAALSSGTSNAPSKKIPITKSLLKSNNKLGIQLILSLKNFNIPKNSLTKDILLIGGTTHLTEKKHHKEGDLSGIQNFNSPKWFKYISKPNGKINNEKDWEKKLDLITKEAIKWDVGYIVGVPSWIILLFEKIINHYQVNTIHDIWPNLKVYVHGGVFIEPYKAKFKQLTKNKLTFIETYLASEGFFAIQKHPQSPLELIINNGIYYEFIPFNDQYFDSEGNLKPMPSVYTLQTVKDHAPYALVISTNGGAWRYLIGDVIQFTDVNKLHIQIIGRTKQYVSICGEHLSIDNMNVAILYLNQKLKINIQEYTLFADRNDTTCFHHWYIGYDDLGNIQTNHATTLLDKKLKEINDDYAVERTSALKNVYVTYIPNQLFYSFLQHTGKVGAQVKFPRVLNKEMRQKWEVFLTENSIDTTLK
jgi:hypothetical protein